MDSCQILYLCFTTNTFYIYTYIYIYIYIYILCRLERVCLLNIPSGHNSMNTTTCLSCFASESKPRQNHYSKSRSRRFRLICYFHWTTYYTYYTYVLQQIPSIYTRIYIYIYIYIYCAAWSVFVYLTFLQVTTRWTRPLVFHVLQVSQNHARITTRKVDHADFDSYVISTGQLSHIYSHI